VDLCQLAHGKNGEKKPGKKSTALTIFLKKKKRSDLAEKEASRSYSFVSLIAKKGGD